MNKQRQPAGFWKIFGASALSNFIVVLIGIILITSIVGAMLYQFSKQLDSEFNSEGTVEIEKHSVLRLDFSTPIDERTYSELDRMSFRFDSYIGLRDVCLMIRQAASDKNIDGIVLNVERVNLGLSSIEEIRNELLRFKSSGKFIYAYGDKYTQKAYYLASAADKVYIYPTGYFEFKGLSSNITFIHDFLTRNNIDIQIIRGSNNQFKSAVEPFIQDEISEANYQQTKRFLDQLWDAMLTDISASRGIDKVTLNIIADSLQIRNAQDAVEYGMMDGALYADAFENLLPKVKDDVNYISLKKYNRSTARYAQRRDDKYYPNIAIIYAFGDIHSGTSKPGSIGDETFVKAINKASDDPAIKSIVLRIDSPGGEALSSDLIWDALRKAKEKKPLVVSMGNVAASAGYMIACPANKIFSDRNTITGSIGVFMVVPNAKDFFEKDLGLHFSRVRTNRHSDLSLLEMSLTTLSRPLTEPEKLILQTGVDDTYDDFLSKIVEGRPSFSKNAEVDSIGQGRVWSGIDAMNLGLTDTIGGLMDALEYAANLVGLKKIKARSYPIYEPGGIEKMLAIINKGSDSKANANSFSMWLFSKINEFDTYTKVGVQQARMLESFDIY